MQERDERVPAGAQHFDERRRRDQPSLPAPRPRRRALVAGGRPASQLGSDDDARGPLVEDERAVGQSLERRVVEQVCARAGLDALGVKPGVDRVGADLPRMKLAPDLEKPVVVLAAAECARTVPGGERGRLVEEKQLGEATGL